MENLQASICASTSSVILFQPLDLIRTKFSLNQQQQNLKQFVKNIFNQEGFKGFYRGMGMQLITSPLSTSLYFAFYEKLKNSQYMPEDQKSKIFVSSIVSGIVSNTITHPMWLLKNQMQADENRQKITTKITQIYKKQGFTGFYSGLSLSFLGISHVAIYFPVYECLKDKIKIDDKNSKSDIIFSSIGAKLIATATTYPNTLLMTMKQCKNEQIQALAKNIYKNQGIRGFFKGLKIDVARSIPANTLTFLVYESLKNRQLG